MTKQSLLKERDRLAEECEDAYFNGEKINGISPQMPDNSFRIGFDAAIELMLQRERVLREAMNAAEKIWRSEGKIFVADQIAEALAQVPEWESGE